MTELSKTKLSVAELEVPKREPLKVVIDDGSKAAKLVCINQNGDLVPNLSLNSFVAEFRVSHEGSKPFNYLVDGLQRYSHHSEASDALETTDVSHQYDEISRLNVHHALHASGITPQEVHVYVTLPLSQFYTSLGETNDENIQRKKDNLLKPIERFVDGKRQSFNIVAVTVFPESLSAVTRADGLENIDSFESSLVIDLGGTTLDIASITGQLEQISKVKGFDRIGCSVIYDEIRRYLQTEKLNSSNAYIQHLIDNRDNKSALKVADAKRDNLFAAVQEALNKLQVMVVKAASQVEETPHNVFLVGGGSYFISEAISQHFVNSNIIVIDEPQFALSLAIADSVFA
ncbi:stbA family protein [Escherichia coli]|jgi:plasmid segregation protein ParM|uniref:plasmid segregation protein ParM domain-containing protein n=1 Tax=Buttiauxella gaviniae TaxID=82990 RepID=UPI001D8CFCA4|nr:stbA family protein [Escherichia coli]